MIGTRWQSKPPFGYGIDHEHPLAVGLVSFWAFNEGTGAPFDIAAGCAATSNTAPWGPGPTGRVLAFNGSGYALIGSAPQLGFAGQFTAVARCAPSTGGGYQILLNNYNASLVTGFILEANSLGNQEIGLIMASGSAQTCSSTSNAVDGNWHTFGASIAGTGSGQVAFFRDGVPFGTSTNSFLPASGAGAVHAIGATIAGAHPLHGPMDWLGVWNRVLSPVEQAMLATNPWQIIRPPPGVPGVPVWGRRRLQGHSQLGPVPRPVGDPHARGVRQSDLGRRDELLARGHRWRRLDDPRPDRHRCQ